MSLFPDEDVITKEIETWRNFIDRHQTDEVVLASFLTVAISILFPYITRHKHICFYESLILALLLQHTYFKVGPRGFGKTLKCIQKFT